LPSRIRHSEASPTNKAFALANFRYWRDLEDFRTTCPLNQFSFKTVKVPFYDVGKGAEAILLFHGASQTAEYSFRRIVQFKDEFRVIVPTINGFRRLDELGQGLTRLLDSRRIDTVHVLGGSFGGMIAQAFFHRHSSRIDRLILAFTMPPLPEYKRIFQWIGLLLKTMPPPLLKWLTKKEMVKMLKVDPSLPMETRELLDFYRAYFLHMLMSVVSKGDLLAQYRLAAEFNGREIYRPEESADHAGRILIITSRNDPNFKYHERLKAQYLKPGEVVYESGGHVGSLVHEEDYVSKIKAILRGR